MLFPFYPLFRKSHGHNLHNQSQSSFWEIEPCGTPINQVFSLSKYKEKPGFHHFVTYTFKFNENIHCIKSRECLISNNILMILCWCYQSVKIKHIKLEVSEQESETMFENHVMNTPARHLVSRFLSDKN